MQEKNEEVLSKKQNQQIITIEKTENKEEQRQNVPLEAPGEVGDQKDQKIIKDKENDIEEKRNDVLDILGLNMPKKIDEHLLNGYKSMAFNIKNSYSSGSKALTM